MAKIESKTFNTKEEINLDKYPGATIKEVQGKFKVVLPKKTSAKGDSNGEKQENELPSQTNQDTQNQEAMGESASDPANDDSHDLVTSASSTYSKVESADLNFNGLNPSDLAPGIIPFYINGANTRTIESVRRLKTLLDKGNLAAVRKVASFQIPKKELILTQDESELVHSSSPLGNSLTSGFRRIPNVLEVAYSLVLDANTSNNRYIVENPNDLDTQDITRQAKSFNFGVIRAKGKRNNQATLDKDDKITTESVNYVSSDYNRKSLNFILHLNKLISNINQKSIENEALSFNDFRVFPNLSRAVFDSLVYDGNYLYLMLNSIVSAFTKESERAYTTGFISQGYKKVLDLPSKLRNNFLETLDFIRDLLHVVPRDSSVDSIYAVGAGSLITDNFGEIPVNNTYVLHFSDYPAVSRYAAKTSLGHLIYYIPTGSLTSKLHDNMKLFSNTTHADKIKATISFDYITEYMATFIFNLINGNFASILRDYKAMFYPFLKDLVENSMYADTIFRLSVKVEDLGYKDGGESEYLPYEFLVNQGNSYHTYVDGQNIRNYYRNIFTLNTRQGEQVVQEAWYDFIQTSHNKTEFVGFAMQPSNYVLPFIPSAHVIDKMGNAFSNNQVTFTHGVNQTFLNVPVSAYAIDAYAPGRASAAVAEAALIPLEGVENCTAELQNQLIHLLKAKCNPWNVKRVVVDEVAHEDYFYNEDSIVLKLK